MVWNRLIPIFMKSRKGEEIQMAMIFETHAHYDDDAFDGDRHELLSTLTDYNIEAVVNICASVRSLDATKALMEKYPNVYGAIGIHPDEVGDITPEVWATMEQLCDHSKTVAVGEIGLDYYWDKENHQKQIYWFERQMDLARTKKLPIVIHSRDAAADTLNAAKANKAGDIGGIVHCFSYGKEMAREYLNMGMYIGVGGVVTFNNGKKLKEVVEYAPLSQIVLETDSPYLSPVPFRGKRNSSKNLSYVAEAIANLKGISAEEVLEVTNRNAKLVFGLNGRDK